MKMARCNTGFPAGSERDFPVSSRRNFRAANSVRTLLLILCATLPALVRAALPADPPPSRDTVVLLHGLGGAPLWMKRLEWALEHDGYEVRNISYPSTRHPVEVLAREHLAPAVERIEVAPGARIHFVTHSLGGLVLRQYLSEIQPKNLGRVVMLGPPNHGSEVADRLHKNWFYKLVLGPSGQQLGTGTDDFPRRLGSVKFELGVIAGNRSRNPFFSPLLPGRDDGMVSVASTQVEGMSDFVVMRSSHNALMWRSPVIKQVRAFVTAGQFRHDAVATTN